MEFLKSPIVASARLRDRPRDFWPPLSSKVNYSEAVIAQTRPQLRYGSSMAGDLLDVMTEEERRVAKESNRPPRTREQLAIFFDHSLLDEAIRAAR